METLGTVVVAVLAVALLVTAVLLVRSKNPHPWPAIVGAMLTSGLCFAVGGGSGENDAGPSVATVIASVVGFLSVAAAIIALLPRSGKAPPPRSPIVLAAGGIGLAGIGLLINLVTG
jgi:drug/metabolite transporter (DMT)-like permease